MRLPDPRERPWLSVAEVAQITGEGEKVIRAALDAGQLPLIQLGRYKRIPTHQLLQQLGMTRDMSEAGPASPAAATLEPAEGAQTHGDTPALRSA
jgi:hypothetical protein